MEITDHRLAALAINVRIAGDRTFHTPLSAEQQQAVTEEIRKTLTKIDAAAGGLRGLLLLAVDDTETTFAIHAYDACATRLAVAAVDKGLELAEKIAQKHAPNLLQMICNAEVADLEKHLSLGLPVETFIEKQKLKD